MIQGTPEASANGIICVESALRRYARELIADPALPAAARPIITNHCDRLLDELVGPHRHASAQKQSWARQLVGNRSQRRI